jgi:hypothetical protein
MAGVMAATFLVAARALPGGRVEAVADEQDDANEPVIAGSAGREVEAYK